MMKKKTLIISTVLVFIFAGAALLVKNFTDYKKKANAYLLDCDLFNADRVFVYSGNGGPCEFLNDGSYFRGKRLSQSTHDISHISANEVVLWSKPIPHHHMFALSHDQKLLYVLSAELKPWRKKTTRFDTILALDVTTGNEVYHWSIYEIKDEMEKQHGSPVPAMLETNPDHQYLPTHYDYEFSHMNSINLIPTNLENELNAELIVNTGRGVELFFTRDLKLVGQQVIDGFWSVNSHDAQITPKGELLLYKNWNEGMPGAALEKYNLADKKRIWLFDKNLDGTIFSSAKFGSVQELEDGGFLYTDMDKGGHFTEIDKDGNKVVDFYSPDKDPRDHLPYTFIKLRKLKYKEMNKKFQGLMDEDLKHFWLSGLYKNFL